MCDVQVHQDQHSSGGTLPARLLALQAQKEAGRGTRGELIHATLKLPTLAPIPDEGDLRLAAKHTKVRLRLEPLNGSCEALGC